MLTGVKDVDRKILIDIDNERDFLSLCASNKSLQNLCQEENIYWRRLEKHYPDIYQKKPVLQTWKEWYLKNMKAIGELNEKYNFTYKSGVPVVYLYALDEAKQNNNDDFLLDFAYEYGYIDLHNLHTQKTLDREATDSEILNAFAGSMSLDQLKNYLQKVKPTSWNDVYEGIMDTLRNKNYVNFNYLIKQYPISSLTAETVGDGLIYAGETGNKDIIHYFVNLFNDNTPKIEIYRWIIYGLLSQNKEELAEEYFGLVKDDISTSYMEKFMSDATVVYNHKSNINYFKFLMDFYLKNKQRFPDLKFEYIWRPALFSDNYLVIEYLLKLGLEIPVKSLNEGFVVVDGRKKHERSLLRKFNKIHL